MPIDRREALLLTGAALVAPSVLAQETKPEAQPKPTPPKRPTSKLITRKIPATGEDVPVIGLGTNVMSTKRTLSDAGMLNAIRYAPPMP